LVQAQILHCNQTYARVSFIMSTAARFAAWVLTTCYVAIILVADADRLLPIEDRTIIKGMSLMQRATRSGTGDLIECTEAVLVEPRAMHYTTVALNSALDVPGVDLITFAHSRITAKFAKQLVKSDATLEKAFKKRSLRLLELPVGDLGGDAEVNEMPTGLVTVNSSSCAEYHHEYTRLLVSPGFWKRLHCNRVLIFQSDTVFCRGSSVKLEEFAAFPYIGGQTPQMGGGLGRIHINGGFSLRSRPAMLQCIEHATKEGLQNTGMGEDEIYSQCPHLKQPPLKLVDRFAIDNALKMPTIMPLGVHKPWGSGPFAAQVIKICNGARALYDAYKAEGC